MREKAEELEEEKVDVRKEDKPIRAFIIPAQDGLPAEIVHITKFKMIKNHKPSMRKCAVTLRKNIHLLLSGPNGIGKSTLLEAMAKGEADGTKIADGVRVGYYRQDFLHSILKTRFMNRWHKCWTA